MANCAPLCTVVHRWRPIPNKSPIFVWEKWKCAPSIHQSVSTSLTNPLFYNGKICRWQSRPAEGRPEAGPRAALQKNGSPEQKTAKKTKNQKFLCFLWRKSKKVSVFFLLFSPRKHTMKKQKTFPACRYIIFILANRNFFCFFIVCFLGEKSKKPENFLLFSPRKHRNFSFLLFFAVFCFFLLMAPSF